jgi:serine/threonine protein kinase
MTDSSTHRKTSRSAIAGADEQSILRLVQGDGVVPVVVTDDPGVVVTRRGFGTVADQLAARGPLPEAQCRGIGVRVARALDAVHARGIAHGDVKPSNLVWSPDGQLWLIDFDASAAAGSPRGRGTPGRLCEPATVTRADDISAIALLVVECASGVLIDPTARWTSPSLVALGCPSGLAEDVVAVLTERPTATRVAEILHRRDNRLPTVAEHPRAPDSTPTIDLTTTVIAGLDPVGEVRGRDG